MENQVFTVSLTPSNKLGTDLAFCSQYDVGRVLCAYIKDASSDFEIPSGATCTLIARKPDGNAYIASVTNMTEYVQITTTEQLTAVAGKVVCEIRIVTSDYSISTANFILRVERCPSDGTTESESVIDIVQTALDAVSEAAVYANNAENSALAAANSAASSAASATEAKSAATDAAEDAAEAVYEQVEEAEKYAVLAQSWAIGGTGSRDGEDTNNSEYWSDYARDLILESLGFSVDDDGNIVQEEIG